MSSRTSKIDPQTSNSEETEEELNQYEYTKLTRPSAIRLLNRRPGRKHRNDEISCQLIEEDLDTSTVK
jgi:hypothetical protein